MYNVASFYYNDENIEKDLEKAIYWYEKASEKKYAKAAYNLSMIYLKENNYVDPKKEFYWTEKAAEWGYEPAIHNLAAAYGAGEGVKKDISKSVELYTKSANKGYVNSMFVLGQIYEEGFGAKKDLVLALAWKEIGMKYANSKSDFQVIEYEQKRIMEIKSMLNKKQILQAKNKLQELDKQFKFTN